MSLIASCLYRLGESIVANNAYRQQEMQHRAKRIQMQAPVTSTTSVRCSSSYPSSNDSKASNIEELIQKLHSGLEVSRIYIPLWNIWHFFYWKGQKWKSKCQTTTVWGTVKFGLDSCLFGMGSFYWAPEQNSGMLYWAVPEGRTPYWGPSPEGLPTVILAVRCRGRSQVQSKCLDLQGHIQGTSSLCFLRNSLL